MNPAIEADVCRSRLVWRTECRFVPGFLIAAWHQAAAGISAGRTLRDEADPASVPAIEIAFAFVAAAADVHGRWEQV